MKKLLVLLLSVMLFSLTVLAQGKSFVLIFVRFSQFFGRFLKKIGLKTQLASRGRLYLVVEK